MPENENSTEPQATPPAAGTEPQAAPAGSTKSGADTLANSGGTPAAGETQTDWRVEMLGEGHEGLEQLQRFKSGKDFFDSFTQAQKTIRSGAHKQPVELGENPTEEELKTFREENGIPPEPKGYLENLPDGLVFGEEDEALINSFIESAHAKNHPPAAVHDMLDWYANTLAPMQAEAEATADKAFNQAATDELREEWGGDFRANLSAVKNFLNANAPQMDDGNSFADMLMAARVENGSKLGDNPHFLRMMAAIANEANPAGFVPPGSGLSQIDAVGSEIAEIEKLMNENPRAYFNDEKKQERLRQLYSAQEKLKG